MYINYIQENTVKIVSGLKIHMQGHTLKLLYIAHYSLEIVCSVISNKVKLPFNSN